MSTPGSDCDLEKFMMLVRERKEKSMDSKIKERVKKNCMICIKSMNCNFVNNMNLQKIDAKLITGKELWNIGSINANNQDCNFETVFNDLEKGG